MAEFWIRQQTSGRVRGPVTSAQLRSLAKQGDVTAADEIGKSREGPWNRADRLQGLQFAPADDALPDFAAMLQDSSVAREPSLPEESVSEAPVVHVDAKRSEDDHADEQTSSRLKFLKGWMWGNSGRSDNKYPALRLIAKAHQTMGVVCLFLAAISLIAFFYFLISYAMSDHTVAEPVVEQQPVNLDNFADQLQQQLFSANSDIENAARRASEMSKIWGSLITAFSLGWGGILCLAFAQVIMLFMDIERNTRRE